MTICLISVAKVASFSYLRKEKSSKLSANVPAIVSNFCNRLQYVSSLLSLYFFSPGFCSKSMRTFMLVSR